MTCKLGNKIIAIHMLPNISRSKGNQTMKFDHLIEYDMKNIFLENLYWKCSGETSPKPFSKKSKMSISLDRQSQILYSWFLLCVQAEYYQNMLKLRYWPLAFTSYKALFRTKRSGTTLPASFSTWFFKKKFSYVTFHEQAKFDCLIVFSYWDHVEILGNGSRKITPEENCPQPQN